MDAIELNIFASRIEAVCDEMGAVLRRAAFSPNIRDRLDYSCAVFDAQGELCAQAAHIPVHLGSMAYAMRDIVGSLQWSEGDMVVVNDPYLGGTHLPDVTVIAPLLVEGEVAAFIANRAHHADIGGNAPGSMPISSTLEEEGVIIPPTYLIRSGVLNEELLNEIVEATGNERELQGDFSAQISANLSGVKRLAELVEEMELPGFLSALEALNGYAERLARAALEEIPDGHYHFSDYLDDDGLGNRDLVISATIDVSGSDIDIDFTGTAGQAAGNVNCPLSVAAAGVYYLFRCLMPEQTPACAGAFRSISITAPEGSLLNARRPAAVAAGNVETSTRVVDVIAGALASALPERIPAASHGSMNNLAMGARGSDTNWDYYETMGGGMGAGKSGGGLSAVQTHMTNTLNTPIEVLEQVYPLRIRRYGVRRVSGGDGLQQGGDGLVREFEFLDDATVTLLMERRTHAPWGIAGGNDGLPGENLINGERIDGKVSMEVSRGDRLTIATPGGGGWGNNCE